MKLVIEIPDKDYEVIRNIEKLSSSFAVEGVKNFALSMIENATPLSESEDCVSLEAVINVFDTWWMNNHETDNAIDVLEEKLNALLPVTPAKKQEPCEDYISRAYIEPIIEELENICVNGDEHILDLLADIKNAPPVTPGRKVGRWTRELIRNEHGGCIGAKMICSECGQDNGYDKRMKFCPNCGKKMEES